MKILYITSENIYGTGSSNLRNVSMIDGLSALGHDVSILSFKVDIKAKKYDEKIKEKLSTCTKYFLTNKSLQKVFAIKKGGNSKSIFFRVKAVAYNILKKIYLQFSVRDTLFNAVNHVNPTEFPQEQFDVLISSSDPISSHALAEMFFKYIPQNKCRWIQYWGDPLLLDITRSNSNKIKLKKIEKGYLERADKIVYTNPLVLDEQKKIYSECAEKMCFVPTPFSFYKKMENQSIEYDIGYFGSYMECVRDIMPLCNEAIANSHKLIVMGGGDQTLPQSKMIDIWPFQSTEVVSEYESKCAVLVCLCNTSRNGNKILQIPGKVYHYAVTDKPVLIIGADDNTKHFLSSYNRFSFAENNVESIAKTLYDILSNVSGIPPKAVKEFDATVIATQFIQ